MKICGKLVDIHNRDIYSAMVVLSAGKIAKIERIANAPELFILPGLIDAHIHIESSMLTPGAFAEAVVKHGTTSVVSDPHEIANVLGVRGVKYMIKDAEKVPVKFFFGAPSCVPATQFERSGSTIGVREIEQLLNLPEIFYLSEMMNFPGVIYQDKIVQDKIKLATERGKPVDGHAPGLTGESLKKYVKAGISTDHECTSIEEALEKISLGMKILIREGSAARNLDALKDLFKQSPEMLMLCSDDLHPEMLRLRHINKIIAELISEGYNIFDVIRSATLNPVFHYNLNAGLLRAGDDADFIIVDSLNQMNVYETWIRGIKVFGDSNCHFKYKPGKEINHFNCSAIGKNDIVVKNLGGNIRVIDTVEEEILTKQLVIPTNDTKLIEGNTESDVLKIVVKDRYCDSPPIIGFIRGFGLKKGAIASSVAHDSHNIISVGTNDNDIVNAVNEIVRMKGGLSVSSDGLTESLKLNIAGIMTTSNCGMVAIEYERLNEMVRAIGCKMKAPFMTLSFMALLVIPDLKIGDKGLFDVNKFNLVSLFV
jgi:adenine deaminase